MNKEKLLSDLNKEAKKLVKKRIIIIRLILNCITLLFCWHWNLFGLSADFKLWHALCIAILFLLSIYSPLWRIMPEKIRYAFYEVANKRAQECVNEIKNVTLEIPEIANKLTSLQEKNDLFSEILDENFKQMKADVAVNA